MDYCFDNFRLWNVSDQMSNRLSVDGMDSQIAGTDNTEIFGRTQSFADLDKSSSIVLPQSAVFGDAYYQVKEDQGFDIAASIEFTYAGRGVGSVQIRATNAQVNQYPFHEMAEDQGSGKEKIDIPIRYIIFVILVLTAVVLLGMLAYYLIQNIHMMRRTYRVKHRDKKRFREIKKGRHTKWKTRW